MHNGERGVKVREVIPDLSQHRLSGAPEMVLSSGPQETDTL
jgi:hypothetical protein